MDIDTKLDSEDIISNYEIEDVKKTTSENVPEYRNIVIDGLNICHEYSKQLLAKEKENCSKFSTEGLNIVYEYFKKLGYGDDKIVIIMKHVPQRFNSDRSIAQKLEEKKVLHYAP